MIYTFAKNDRSREAFLAILQESGLDFEISEHDVSVVRVFGSVTPQIKARIESVAVGASRLTLAQRPEMSCYEQISGRTSLTIIAGPCAVESEEQIVSISEFLRTRGVKFLRGGAFKPRTSVDSFQGLGKPGLKLLRQSADRYGMFVVTEVMDRSQIEIVGEYADILQVGSRNMYNYTLLAALGSINRPILLKRGMAATIDEWLAAAEYISRGGNDQIILCERGIRTFEPKTAHTLDLAAIALVKEQCSYPVIADPSHAAGRPDLVKPLACAAVAAGADGIMIEIHPSPEQALSDGKQALTLEQFAALHDEVLMLDKARRQ